MAQIRRYEQMIPDHLGSRSVVANGPGTLIERTLYHGWGTVRFDNQSGEWTQYTYTGQYSNVADFGLMFYNARFYDPSLGRFTSADSLIPDPGNPLDYDRYAYSYSNPVKYIDPDGHCPICALILLALFVTSCGSQSASQPASPIDSAVNITDSSGNHTSLGTQISGNTVLTHNHFGSPLNTYSVVDSTGIAQTLSGAASDPIGQDVVIDPTGVNTGQQTRLITFPNQLAGSPAQIASQQTINGIQLGDMVDIAYWDDANGQVTTGQFSISDVSNLGNGAVSVDDPLGILNPGDSGGGVYYYGQLIGNLWSIVGGGHIALVPPGTNEKSKANIPVR